MAYTQKIHNRKKRMTFPVPHQITTCLSRPLSLLLLSLFGVFFFFLLARYDPKAYIAMDVLDNINYLFDRDDLIVDNDQVRVESSAHHCLSLFESVSSSSIFTSLQQYAKTCFPKMKDTIVLGTPTITTWSHSDGFSELERLVGSIHS